MARPWHIAELLTGIFFALCVVDVALEVCLIHLLRRLYNDLWIKAGSPRGSLWACSFSARRFVMSQADRLRHDALLSGYCWFYRAFNVVFMIFIVLAPAASLAAFAWRFFRR